MFHVTKRLVIAAAVLAWGSSAQAVTFDFFWSAGATDTGIISAYDDSITATGQVTINKLAGESFTATDLTSASITVKSNLLSEFSLGVTEFTLSTTDFLRSFSVFAGTIAADGLTASINDLFGETSDGSVFGCNDPQVSFTGFVNTSTACEVAQGVNIVAFNGLQSGSTLLGVLYGSPAEASASYKLTRALPPQATVVPLPAGVVLLLTALGGLAISARRKA